MEEQPFPELKLAPFNFLDDITGRSTCQKCGKSRKYYCYTCYKPTLDTHGKMPHVKLPIKVDIIKHPCEVTGKSTSGHAAVLAPDDVIVYTYPIIPDYPDPTKVVLVFPGEDSLTLQEYMLQYCQRASDDVAGTCRVSEQTEETSVTEKTDKELAVAGDEESSSSSHKRNISSTGDTEDCQYMKRLKKLPKYKYGFERVVFIDSTWHQVNKISSDERLRGLQRIELKSRETKFWRHQKDKPRTYLATIEAIYYFMCDYHEHVMLTDYQGEYDNLLFLFCFMYQKIRHLFDGGKHLKAYNEQK